MIALIFLELFLFFLSGWKVWLLAHALGFSVCLAMAWIEDEIKRRRRRRNGKWN